MPCELVRVVTGELAGAGPEGAARAMGWCVWSPARPSGPRQDCRARGCVRRARASRHGATTGGDDRADEPACVRAACPGVNRPSVLIAAPPARVGDPGRRPGGARACSWRTMWIVRRITCVVTAGADCAPQATPTTAAGIATRNLPDLRRAAPPRLRRFGCASCASSGPPVVGDGVLCCARAIPRPTLGKGLGKPCRALRLPWRSLYSPRPTSWP